MREYKCNDFPLLNGCDAMEAVCPHCRKKLEVSDSHLGILLSCPLCNRPFLCNSNVQKSPSSETSKPLDEEILSRDAIKAGELLEFIHGLPERVVTCRFPDGSEHQVVFKKFVEEISAFDPGALAFTPNKHGVVQEVRKQSGWVCVKYGPAFEVLQSVLNSSESHIVGENDAHQVVKILREIESHVEIGISRDEYARLLSSRWLHVKDFADKHCGSYPIFVDVVQGAFQSYRNALDMWVQGANTLPFQFTGGGFGLSGAAQGMALSIGLNSLVGAYNQSKQKTLAERRAAEWAFGSKKIAIARSVLQNGG